MNNINEPKWLDNAVFYEIYPQSFNDTNADGIGDINGITEKLDYIKDLGCNAIWINPCFKRYGSYTSSNVPASSEIDAASVSNPTGPPPKRSIIVSRMFRSI